MKFLSLENNCSGTAYQTHQRVKKYVLSKNVSTHMKLFPKFLEDNAYAQEILTSRREEKK